MFQFISNVVFDCVQHAIEDFPITPITLIEVSHIEGRWHVAEYAQLDLAPRKIRLFL